VRIDVDRTMAVMADHLGEPRRDGWELSYWCPFCVGAGYGKRSHLHVNYTKGVALCHQCGAGFRSLRTMLMGVFGRLPPRVSGIYDDGGDLSDSVESLLFKPTAADACSDDDATGTVALPDGFVPLVRKPKDRLGQVIFNYLVNERNVPFDRLVDIGCGYVASGTMRGYAVFPVHVNGRLVTYTSRRVTAVMSKVRHGTSGPAASAAIFNYDNAHAAKRVFIGEGPFDAFALHRRLRDTDAGLATMGTVLHPEQAHLIAKLPCKSVYVWYDADAMTKATEAAAVLAKYCEKNIYMVRHQGNDPDELPEQELRRLVKGAEFYEGEMSTLRSLLAV